MLVLLGIVLAMALSSCKSVDDLKPQHGTVAVGMEGRKLYFKRETRGLSYDVLWLSENPDRVRPMMRRRMTSSLHKAR